MTTFHAVVWLDHAQAHVLHFDADAADATHLKLRGKHARHPQQADVNAFFADIGNALEDASEVLVTGSSGAAADFAAWARGHRPVLEKRIVGVETLAQPTDNQLVAHARKAFVKLDRFNGTPTPS